MASASAELPSGSPPPSRAATEIARASLVKCWPRRASTTAFLCLIDAHLEWPDIYLHFRTRGLVGGQRRASEGGGVAHPWVRRSPGMHDTTIEPLPADRAVQCRPHMLDASRS